MDRKWLAPGAFLLALVMYFLPFTTVQVGADPENARDIGLSASAAEQLRLKASLTAVDLISLARAPKISEAEDAVQEVEYVAEQRFGSIFDNLLIDVLDGDVNVDRFVEEANEFIDETKGPLLVVGRFFLWDDNTYRDIKDSAYSGSETAEQTLQLIDISRSRARLLFAVLVLSAAAFVVAAILGFMDKPRMAFFAGVAGGAFLVVLGIASMVRLPVTIDPAVLQASLSPGVGLLASLLLAVVGCVVAYLTPEPLASARVAHEAFVPQVSPASEPSPQAYAEGVERFDASTATTQAQAEPEARPSTDESTLMAESGGQSGGPAWGATVIEDAASEQKVFASLRVVSGTGVGRGYDLKVEGETRLGRDVALNDIVIPDAKASAQHAKIRHEEGGFKLFDLGSTNGTWVNEVRVAAPVILKADDRIKIGDTVMVFQIAEA